MDNTPEHLAFRDVFGVLRNLDKSDLEDAGIMPPNQVGGGDWERFNQDVGLFVLKLNDERLGKLHQLVASRSKKFAALQVAQSTEE